MVSYKHEVRQGLRVKKVDLVSCHGRGWNVAAIGNVTNSKKLFNSRCEMKRSKILNKEAY